VLVDAVIMPSYTRHGVAVQVPNVEDRPFTKAKQLVQRRDLRVKRQVGRYNPNVAQDVVVDQNPPPDADVKPGRRVYLTVNAGEVPMVDVPDFNGISVREARNRVTSLGLKVGTVNADSIPSPYPNTITGQKPEPGDSLKTGGTVDLWYSTGLGSDTVQVPSIVGRTVEKAQRQLLRRKLRAIVVDSGAPDAVQDTAQSADTLATPLFVRRQGRTPGTSVRAGTEIRLFTTSDSTQVPKPDSTLRSPDAPAGDTTGLD
jgi:beta-lactam-binding protein with PASTA domain